MKKVKKGAKNPPVRGVRRDGGGGSPFALFTAVGVMFVLVIFAGMYAWQRSSSSESITELKQEIEDLRSEFVQSREMKEEELKEKQEASDDEKVIETVERSLPLWVYFWRSIDSDFDLAAFNKTNVREMKEMETLLQEEGEDGLSDMENGASMRRNLITYSLDQAYYVDPYGSVYMHTENGEVRAGFDVDSYVRIVDVENNLFADELFCGPSCSYEDVAWIDNASFVLVGSEEVYEESLSDGTAEDGGLRVPMLWLFDLENKTVTLYVGEKVKSDRYVLQGSYLELKYPELFEDEEIKE